MSDKYQFDIRKILDRETEKMTGKGHIMSGWILTDNLKYYTATCQKCHGVVYISNEDQWEGPRGNSIGIIGHDYLTSQEFCPADDPELMKRLDDDWSRRLGNVANILFELAMRKEAEIGSSETAEHQ